MSVANGRLTLEWPDTHHPAFDHMAESVRRIMAQGASGPGTVRYAKPQTRYANFYGDGPGIADAVVQTGTLEIHKAWARAPYIGRPFVYAWKVAVDDLGRWVAGPASIEYTVSEGDWLIRGGA